MVIMTQTGGPEQQVETVIRGGGPTARSGDSMTG